MKTAEVYMLLEKIKREIDSSLMRSSFGRRCVLDMESVVLENGNDPDEIQKRNALCSMLEKLESVSLEMEFLERPVRDTGVLYRKDNGRYAFNDLELTSGCAIEILVEDPEGEEPSYWARTRIEHDGSDYFAVYGSRRLDGLKARMRE